MDNQELIIELTRKNMQLERDNKNYCRWWQGEKNNNDTLKNELMNLKNKLK